MVYQFPLFHYLDMGSIADPDYLTAVPLEDKFAAFSVFTHTYKVVDEHPILVDVAIPKKLLSQGTDALKKVPVCIRLHGGWLVRSNCPLDLAIRFLQPTKLSPMIYNRLGVKEIASPGTRPG